MRQEPDRPGAGEKARKNKGPQLWNLAPTAIGSLPHTSAEDAVQFVLSHLTELPFWPQLPRRDERENMYVQFAEGLPGLTRDAATGRWFVDTDQDLTAPMERVYAQVLGERESGVEEVSDANAAGLRALLGRVPGRSFPALKGQITGPVSVGLALTDRGGRPILYDRSLMDCLVKLLALKADWQQRLLEGVADRVLIVIDEPYLTAMGTSVVNLPRETWVAYMAELRNAMTCLVGLHCCGNTDWGELAGEELSFDVLSFDALSYFTGIEAYARPISRFLERGGALAWGIVPNMWDQLRDRSREDLVAELSRRLGDAVNTLAHRAGAGVDAELVRRQSLLTPVCGLGPADVATARRSFGVLLELARSLRLRV